jgi:hypothetical protein
VSAIDHQLPHLAARLLGCFDQSDLEIALRELQGRNQSGDARAHHHHAMLM